MTLASMKNQICAKVAAQAGDLYSEAAGLVRDSSVQRNWIKLVVVFTFYNTLLYWRDASHNTLDYCIGGMHLTIH